MKQLQALNQVYSQIGNYHLIDKFIENGQARYQPNRSKRIKNKKNKSRRR